MSAGPGERIETERLVLRRPGPDDVAVFALADDEPDEEHAAALAHWAEHGFGHWIVEERESGRPVGVFEVHFCWPGVDGIGTDEVELGWWLAEDARGRGYATEAGVAAIADAWRRTRVAWLAAYIRPWNEPSMRVADRLGMRHVKDGKARNGDPVRIYRVDRPS